MSKSSPTNAIPLLPTSLMGVPTRDPNTYLILGSDPPHYVYWSAEPSKTLQGPAADSDINVIVSRLKSGALLPPDTGRGYYGDATASPNDLATAMNLVARARSAFDQLPPMVRLSMANDPANLQAWLGDPENRPMAEKYGLINPSAPNPPLQAGSAPPSSPTPGGGDTK